MNNHYDGLVRLFHNRIPSLGIISGAGPEAGAVLYKQVTQELQQHGAWRDAHFPFVHVVNFPFAEMLTPPIDHAKVSEQISAAVDYMIEQLHCDYVVIACNTLHHFLPEAMPSQFISLVQLINHAVPTEEVPLVFASRTSAEANLHGKLLGRTVDYYDPPMSQQTIDRILAGKKVDLAHIEEVARRRPTILGCTEYSAALSSSSAPFIDPMKLVAKKYYAAIQQQFKAHVQSVEAELAQTHRRSKL